MNERTRRNRCSQIEKKWVVIREDKIILNRLFETQLEAIAFIREECVKGIYFLAHMELKVEKASISVSDFRQDDFDHFLSGDDDDYEY